MLSLSLKISEADDSFPELPRDAANGGSFPALFCEDLLGEGECWWCKESKGSAFCMPSSSPFLCLSLSLPACLPFCFRGARLRLGCGEEVGVSCVSSWVITSLPFSFCSSPAPSFALCSSTCLLSFSFDSLLSVSFLLSSALMPCSQFASSCFFCSSSIASLFTCPMLSFSSPTSCAACFGGLSALIPA